LFKKKKKTVDRASTWPGPTAGASEEHLADCQAVPMCPPAPKACVKYEKKPSSTEAYAYGVSRQG